MKNTKIIFHFVTDTLDMCGGWYGISERFHSHCQRVSGGNLMQDVVLQNNGGEYLTRSAQRELQFRTWSITLGANVA